MTRPAALIGSPVDGSFLYQGWELRVTSRCLEEDLAAARDAPFDEIAGQEIVKTFVKDRADRTDDTRQVSPLGELSGY